MRIENPAPNVAPIGRNEVRPEEITELVDRLHRREEGISVNDVAETLGVAPETVEATLRAMRVERVPPIVKNRAERQSRRFRRLAILAACFVVGGTIFAMGRETGIKRGRVLAQFQGSPFSHPIDPGISTRSLAERLRTALPEGVTVTVGDLSYTGAPGSVYENESELAPLITELIDSEGRRGKAGIMGTKRLDANVVDAIRRGEGSAPGFVRWVPIRVTRGSDVYENAWPIQVAPVAPDSGLNDAIIAARHRVAIVAANRISEWATSQRP